MAQKILQEFYFADWQFSFYGGSYVCYLEQRPVLFALQYLFILLGFLVPPNTRTINHPFAIAVNHPFKLGRELLSL